MRNCFDPRIQLIVIVVAMTLSLMFLEVPVYSIISVYLLIQLLLIPAVARQLLRLAWLLPGVAAFTLLLHLLFGSPDGVELTKLLGVSITRGQLETGLLYCWRVLLLFTTAAWLLVVLERDRLADVIDWALQPLSRTGLAIGGVTMSLRIALRTIPYLQSEHARITLAQRARGARFGGAPIARISRQAQIMVPLLAATLRRGDRLGDALQVRHWRADVTPTKLHQFKLGWHDILQLVLTVVLVVAIFGLK